MAIRHGRVLHSHGVSDHTFALAIAVSIAAHALILLAAPWWLDPSRKRLSAPPIVAHLLPVPPAPAPVPVVKPRTEPKVEREPRPVRNAPPIPSAQPVPTLPPVIAAPVLQAPPALEAPRALEPVSPPVVASVPSARPEAPAPAKARIAGDAFDPLTLGQYRIAIITAAKRYKKYPRLALDNNWEGQAEIRMVIGSDGTIASISIKTGSGFEVLDQQALEMIRKAKPLAPIPAQLRGKGFTVDVPVVFSLREETG
jgi:protein TonB